MAATAETVALPSASARLKMNLRARVRRGRGSFIALTEGTPGLCEEGNLDAEQGWTPATGVTFFARAEA